MFELFYRFCTKIFNIANSRIITRWLRVGVARVLMKVNLKVICTSYMHNHYPFVTDFLYNKKMSAIKLLLTIIDFCFFWWIFIAPEKKDLKKRTSTSISSKATRQNRETNEKNILFYRCSEHWLVVEPPIICCLAWITAEKITFSSFPF